MNHSRIRSGTPAWAIFSLVALIFCPIGAMGAGYEPDDLSIAHTSAPSIERVTVPAGEFLMGSPDGARPGEGPQHRVALDTYQISTFEITWAQYQAFIDAGGYTFRDTNGYWSQKGAFFSNYRVWWTEPQGGNQSLERPAWLPADQGPPGFRDTGHWPPHPDDPVVGISYWEAEAFCRFVGGRLPTEAEWEKAACWGPNASAPFRYPWGDDLPSPLPGNGFEISRGFGRISEVNDPLYDGDRSRYGVRGLGGNVREWVADMYDPDFYSQGPEGGIVWENPFNYMAKRLDYRDNPGVQLPAEWVTRGGRYDEAPHSSAEKFSCAYRRSEGPISRHHTIGFRVAWDLDHKEAPPLTQREEAPGAAVSIPGGRYVVGQKQGAISDVGSRPDEGPQHEVCLNPFWIGKYEVTWYEYKKFMEAGGYDNPEWWSVDGWKYRLDPSGNGGYFGGVTKPDILGLSRPIIGYELSMRWKGPWLELGEWASPPDDHPVVGLSWFEAEAFCNYVGGRLPKEVEWEVAATWNPDTGYPQHFTWGNLFTFTHTAKIGNTGDDLKYRGIQSSPVGMYPDGKSPFGCYDMAGNAFEWTEDWYNPNSYSQHSSECGGSVTTPDWMKIDAPHGPTQDPIPGWKVNRGGGFDPTFDGTYSQRARTRGTDGSQSFRNFTFGFRVAWDSDPQSIPRAQSVRPEYANGTDRETPPTPVESPASPNLSSHERVFPTARPSVYLSSIAGPAQEDWYRVYGPAGTLVTIDVDANGGPDAGKSDSPLDAAIEIWHTGIDLPVLTRDDETVYTGDVNYHPNYTDPPITQHVMPREGFFWVKVRAYYWPAEGSQAGLSKGERSYHGPDYSYELSLTAPGLNENIPREDVTGSVDLNGDGTVNAGDLLTLLSSARSKSSKILQADLDGDGGFTFRDVFLLEKVWSMYGQSAKRKLKDNRPVKSSTVSAKGSWKSK